MPINRPIRVIIDTDPGVDDALAILLALRSPELDVVAITTVCGNVPVEQATRNLFRVLSLVKPPSHLLIGQGAARPLVRPLETATRVHGTDGLGEVDRLRNKDGSLRYPQPDVPRSLPIAQEVWAECARRYPNELTLITLGPLTNLAQALEAEPAPAHTFRQVLCMGGAVTVPGNVTPAAEFNMYVDPHAAQRVFQSGLPVTLVPLDVTLQVALTKAEIQRMTGRTSNPLCRFVGDVTAPALAFAEQVEGKALLPLHDPLAVGAAIAPSLVKPVGLHIQVETEGRVTLGQTLADRRSLRGVHRPPPNLRVVLKVDAARFLKLFRERLCPRRPP